MVISYTAKQVEINEEMKSYLEKRLQKIKFYFDHILKIDAIVGLQRGKYTTEVKITANRDTYFAEATDADWKKSFDDVSHKIEGEIKKKKDKITDHHKAPSERQ